MREELEKEATGQNSGTKVKVWGGTGFAMPGQNRGRDKGRSEIVENKHQSSLRRACRPGIVLYNVGIAFYVFQTAILGCK